MESTQRANAVIRSKASDINWCRLGNERAHLWGPIPSDGKWQSWCGQKKSVNVDHLVLMPLSTAGKCKLCRKSLRRMVRISEEGDLPLLADDIDDMDEVNE